MDMLQENKIKRLFKIELWCFLIFIITASIFYNYKDAHIYYYKDDFFSHYNGIIALIGKIIFICFFWISVCFPIVWILQLIILIWKKYFKRLWILFSLVTVLYIISVFATFFLYSINQHQSFLERKELNKKEIENNRLN